MKTQLKPKTVPVKEVTKSSPSTSPRTSNDGANRTVRSNIEYKLAPSRFSGMQVAKLKNQ